jgi:hypothetical protein
MKKQAMGESLLDSTEHQYMQGMFYFDSFTKQPFSHHYFHFIFVGCHYFRSSLSEISAPRMAVAN